MWLPLQAMKDPAIPVLTCHTVECDSVLNLKLVVRLIWAGLRDQQAGASCPTLSLPLVSKARFQEAGQVNSMHWDAWHKLRKPECASPCIKVAVTFLLWLAFCDCCCCFSISGSCSWCSIGGLSPRHLKVFAHATVYTSCRLARLGCS